MYGSSLKKQTTIKPVQAIGGLPRRLGLWGVPEEELGGYHHRGKTSTLRPGSQDIPDVADISDPVLKASGSRCLPGQFDTQIRVSPVHSPLIK